uniref:Uncharacterized protein n=1 Tax=Arundo donax TaxID=35708 RepID=A0A0A9G0A2_ARUDO
MCTLKTLRDLLLVGLQEPYLGPRKNYKRLTVLIS